MSRKNIDGGRMPLTAGGLFSAGGAPKRVRPGAAEKKAEKALCSTVKKVLKHPPWGRQQIMGGKHNRLS